MDESDSLGPDKNSHTFERNVVAAFLRLLTVDNHAPPMFTAILEDMFDLGYIQGLVEDKDSLRHYRNIHLVGSVGEGMAIAKFFEKFHLHTEIDMMFSLATLQESALKEFVSHTSLAFCRIKNSEAMWNAIKTEMDISDTLFAKLDRHMSESNLSGKAIKTFIERVIYFDPQNKYFDNLFAAITRGPDKPFRGFEAKVQVTRKIHGPAVALHFDFFKKGTDVKYFNVILDAVPMIQVEFWPSVAQEWITRTRLWPPKHVIEAAIQQGCQLVPKPKLIQVGASGTEEEELEDDFQWRMSFTLAEKVINLARTDLQKLVYLITKSIFYFKIKTDKDTCELSSYVLKTSMMWLQEEKPTNCWTEQNALCLVKELYDRLYSWVCQKHIPYYFIPEENLIDKYDHSFLEKVKQKLNTIKDNINGNIPLQIDYVAELVRFVLQMAEDKYSKYDICEYDLD